MKEVKFLLVIWMILVVLSHLCLVLPQMSDWIKYFENGGKNVIQNRR